MGSFLTRVAVAVTVVVLSRVIIKQLEKHDLV